MRESTKNNELKKSENIINEQPLNINTTKNIMTITSDIENIEESDIEEKNSAEVHEKRNITILGDSMIKHIERYKMRQGMKNNEKIYVKTFPGAKTTCMEDYIKPSLKNKPDVILLHVGTNNLKSEDIPENIADDIIKLATNTRPIAKEVIISGIVARNDQYNKKGNEVNNFLKSKCVLNNLTFCDNSNISRNYHTNGSGLHLNYRGTVALANNFLRCLNN